MNIGTAAPMRAVLVGLVCLCPMAAVVFVIARERQGRLARRRSPFQELRRRPAGEALRIKLAELDDKISESISFLLLPPIIVALVAWLSPALNSLALLPSVLFALVLSAIIATRFYRRIIERDNYRLGYEGERFVGEELTRLIAAGFEIFHDVPFKDFNIDHVLVGRAGIFSVETKTRRKPFSDSKGKEYHVEFDGACLRWPWGTDSEGIHQAARNADTLAKWLSSAVGDPVPVTPILALPGWWVDRKARPNSVHVLNPKEIATMCQSGQSVLPADLVRRVCHQLEEKCKLEFQ